jgi:hypothetical protein
VDITPYKNGVHSLAEGLNCLHKYFDTPEDPYLMKEVVLKVHHGLETLLKDLLFQRNPVFLLVDKTKVSEVIEFYKGFYNGQNSYLFDEAKTITPDETINRIKDLKIISGISNKDFQQLASSFKTLNSLRNQLQHFAIKANPDAIIRVLGNLVPRTVSVLKTYYASQGRNAHQPLVDTIPHQPLLGMEGFFTTTHNIDADLNAIFSESTKIINLLEVKYDSLLKEAIRKLQGSTTEKVGISFKLRDHGNVGAPPYMPEITLEGWLNEKFEPHRNSSSEDRFHRGEELKAVYDSSLKIEQPEIVSGERGWGQNTTSKFTIRSESKVDIKSLSFFQVDEIGDYLQFIKSPTVNIILELTCTSVGMFDSHHFDVRDVLSLEGVLKVELISSVFGDPKDSPSIFGEYQIPLNEDNTTIRFHSFVESNGKLRDHYSLELGVEDQSVLAFKKLERKSH